MNENQEMEEQKVIEGKKPEMEGEKISETSSEETGQNQEDIDTKRTKCEVYSRVVGYLRPVMQWNDGKQAEWKDRKMFKV